MEQIKTRIAGWIDYLINPLVDLPVEAQKRSRTSASLVLISFIASLLLITLFHLLDSEPHPRFLVAEITMMLVLIFTYLLSRTQFYRLANLLTVAVLSIGFYALATPGFGSQINFLVLLIIPVIFVTRISSPNFSIYFTLLNLFAITLLPSFYDDVTYDINIFWAFILVALSGMLLIITDVVIGRKDQDEDKAEFGSLATISEASPYLIAIFSDDQLLYLNPVGQKLLELSDEEYKGLSIQQFELNSDQPTNKIRKIPLQDGFAVQMEQIVTSRSGYKIPMQITSMPILVEGKFATQIIGIDLRERNDLLRKLDEANTRSNLFTDLVSAYLYEYENTTDDNQSKTALKLVNLQGNFEKTTGYVAEQAERWETLEKLIYPEDEFIYQQHIQQVLQGESGMVEYRIITANNGLRWVCDYGRPQRDKFGLIKGISGVIQDISDRMEPETALKSHALQQAVVAELGQHALRYPEREMVFLEETVTLASQVLDCEYCIFYERENSGKLIAKSWTGWDEESIEHSIDPKTDMYRSHAAFTFSQREPVIIPDMRHDKRLKLTGKQTSEHFTSGAGIPIHGREQTLGTLMIHSTQHRNFSIDDVNFLQAIANILGGFIEQRHIRAEEAEQRSLAEALKDIAASLNSTLNLDKVMDKVLENISRVVPHDAASIMLINKGTARIIRHSGFLKQPGTSHSVDNAVVPIAGSNIISTMLQTQQSVFISDVLNNKDWIVIEGGEWIRAYVGAPILFEDQVIGILNVDSATTGGFSQEHALRLQAFADQAAIAIRNAQLTDQLEQVVNERTRALNTERNTLRSVLDATGEGIYYTVDTTIVYANPAICRMTGYTEAELIGKSTAFLIGHNTLDNNLNEQWESTHHTLANGKTIRSEHRLIRKDGSPFQAAVTLSAIQTDDDTGLNIVAIVRDISEEKALSEQKTRFIANASHELRSPIASMNTRLYLLKRDRENLDKHIDLMGRIMDRMNRLVEDLLDMSRFENGVIQLQKRDVILQNIIVDVVEQFEAEATDQNLTLDYIMPSHPIHAFVDPDRVIQVITNLVNNAIRYTERQGKVNVKLTTSRDNGSSYAMIFVEDTGMGIPQEHLAQIFQPFYRGENKVRGTGLGLSIAREIALLHNGDIIVESTLGKGSTFCVKLPEHTNLL